MEIDRLLNNFYAQSREYNLAVAAKISSLCKDIDARRITMSDYIKTGVFADCFVDIVSNNFQELAAYIKSYLFLAQDYLFKEYYNPRPQALQYLINNTADFDYKAIDKLMKLCSSKKGAYVFTLEFIEEKIKIVREFQKNGQFRSANNLYDTLDKIATIQPNIPAVFRMDESKKVTVKEVKKKQQRSELFKTEKEILFIVSGIALIGFTCDALCTWVKKKFAKKKDTPVLKSELKTSKA